VLASGVDGVVIPAFCEKPVARDSAVAADLALAADTVSMLD